MGIYVELDVELAKKKMRLNEFADKVDLSIQNMSILKSGKAKAIRFSTLAKICEVLQCQPGDILKYSSDSSDLVDEEV